MHWKIKKFRQFKFAVIDDFEDWYDIVRSSCDETEEETVKKQVQENLKRLEEFINKQQTS
jgi:hypothetical protein